MEALPKEKKRSLRFSLVTVAMLMGVAALSACGGGGGGGSNPNPPNPPPVAGTGITVFPGTTTVALGGKAVFTGYVPSAPTTANFTWAVTGGAANGSITTDGSGKGDYVAPTAPPAGPVTVTVTSGTLGGSATITITAAAAGGVAVSPAAIAVPAGSTFQFGATVGGVAAVVTQWQVHGAAGGSTLYGTIDSLGNYTAPAMPPPGGSTTITAVTAAGSATSTATVVFSNSSISGPYTFAYSGDDGSGFLAVAGSFTASSGTLSGGEDGTDAQATSSKAITGVYAIGPDGRGTFTIAGGVIPAGETWRVAITADPTANPGSPAQHAVLIRFDTNGTGSGTLDQQNTIATPFPAGSYAFGISGLSGNGAEVSAAGKFSSTGNGGTVTNASVWDVNYAGTPIVDDTTLVATFTPAPSGFAGSVGRGTLTLFSTNTSLNVLTGQTPTSTFQFVYYLVDSTHVKVVENDGHAFLSGDFFSGPTTPDGSFTAANILKNGNYAFTVGGASTMGSYTAGGVFAYSTTGTQTNTGVMDINNDGVVIPLDKTLTASSTVDTNLGRISFIFTPAGTTTGYTFSGYTTSTGTVEMVEIDTGLPNSGVAYPQTATAQPSGTFATNISGATTTGEQDVDGQFSVTNGAFAGSLDINNLSDPGPGAVYPGLGLTSTTAIVAPDANGRGTMTLATSVETYQLVYYVIGNQTVLMMGKDGTHVVLGNMGAQF